MQFTHYGMIMHNSAAFQVSGIKINYSARTEQDHKLLFQLYLLHLDFNNIDYRYLQCTLNGAINVRERTSDGEDQKETECRPD